MHSETMYDAKVSFKEMRKYSTVKRATISGRLPRSLRINTGKTGRDENIHA